MVKKEKEKEKEIKKILSKVQSRQVLRKTNLVVSIPESKPHSILAEKNTFFQGELNKEKRRLFFG